jgi:hypothetical protein
MRSQQRRTKSANLFLGNNAIPWCDGHAGSDVPPGWPSGRRTWGFPVVSPPFCWRAATRLATMLDTNIKTHHSSMPPAALLTRSRGIDGWRPEWRNAKGHTPAHTHPSAPLPPPLSLLWSDNVQRCIPPCRELRISPTAFVLPHKLSFPPSLLPNLPCNVRKNGALTAVARAVRQPVVVQHVSLRTVRRCNFRSCSPLRELRIHPWCCRTCTRRCCRPPNPSRETGARSVSQGPRVDGRW